MFRSTSQLSEKVRNADKTGLGLSAILETELSLFMGQRLARHLGVFLKRLIAGYGVINLLVPLIIAPLYGVPCGMYKIHHKVMHHVVSQCQRKLIYCM